MNACPDRPAPPAQTYRRRRGDSSLPPDLTVLHPDAAGIDIGAHTHYVSVPEDRAPEAVRSFGCYTPDLEAMAQWLLQCRVTTVVMESTGVYWIPVFRVLEAAGLEVLLVDARHVKYVPGRKSDVADCQWLRRLHTHGLLTGAFVPPQDVAALRAYARQRKTLVESCAREIQHMQKALVQMNLHLHVALSDLAGVSGLRIVRAIVGGQRDPEALAALAHPTVHASPEELARALTGHYTDAHVFALAQALELYDVYAAKIEACDRALEACLARFPSKGDPAACHTKRNKRKRRKNEPHFDLRAELVRMLGVDLTGIDGIDALTAFTVVSEIGGDVSAFPTVKAFASWLGLCPGNTITGGKVKKRKTKAVQNRVASALRVAAQSLHRSDSYLGAYYRRLRGRLGAPKAITATAHKLARLIYALFKHGQAYVDKGQAYLEAQHRERTVKGLIRRATHLGLEVVDLATGEILTPV